MMTRALNGTTFIGLRLNTSLGISDTRGPQGIVEGSQPPTHLGHWTKGEEVVRRRGEGLGGGHTRGRSSSLESISTMSSARESVRPEPDSDSGDDASEDETTPPPSLPKMALMGLRNIREALQLPIRQTAPLPSEPDPPLTPSVEAEAHSATTLRRPRASLPLEHSPSTMPTPTPPVPTTRRAPKSLSRRPRKPSSSPPSNPPKPAPLPTIEVHFQVARLALLHGFSKFQQYFQHELGTPDFQSVFDNPIPEHVAEAEFLLQPMIVTHRMYWQGEEARVPEALATALDTSLTRLVITNCKIALDDVIAVLVLVDSLEALEVREVTRDDAVVAPSFLRNTLTEGGALQVKPHGLKSLTLKSRVPLDTLFRQFNFKRLDLLSLRLHDEAIYTDFDFLSPAARRRHNIRSARLRGNFTLPELERLRGWLQESGVSFDVERSSPAHGDRVLPSTAAA